MNRNPNVAPPNYDSSTGKITFEIGGVDGPYFLQIDSDFKHFSLSLPDGSKIRDTLTNIRKYKNELRKYEEKLYDWINDTLQSHHSKHDMDIELKRHEILIDGFKYRLKFNVYNGIIELSLPEYFIFADRCRLTDSYFELRFMAFGSIINIILDQIGNAISNIDVRKLSPPATLPIHVVRPKEFEIGENLYRIQYISERDVCFIQIPDRFIKTHISTILADMPELPYIQHGKLLQEINKYLQEFGTWIRT